MFKDTLLPCHFTTTVLAAFSVGNCQKKHNLGSDKLHNRGIQFPLKLAKAFHLATSATRPNPQHTHEFSTSSKLTADELPTVVAALRNRSENDKEFWRSAARIS